MASQKLIPVTYAYKDVPTNEMMQFMNMNGAETEEF